MTEPRPDQRRLLILDDDPELARIIAGDAALKGFAVSIDDFGTGFSSMRQLAQLPFSELKVDRSFVGSMRASTESHTIVRATVDLAHNLHLIAVAEGVEDRQTLELLLELECDMFQGYYIAPPLTLDALREWRQRWHGWSSVV